MTSARQYSELLRLACVNGWKFRRSDVVVGFNRRFEELRLILLDRGVTIVPLPYIPELEVTEIVFGLIESSSVLDRPSCFRARWRKPMGRGPRAIPEVRSVAD